jgi:hypothetical protein
MLIPIERYSLEAVYHETDPSSKEYQLTNDNGNEFN